MNAKARIAQRAAREIADGDVINLGIGIPTMLLDHLADTDCYVHSENGVLGLTGVAPGSAADPEIVDAGKRPAAVVPGASYFDSAASFAMIRGGHVDVSVMGALQVDARGRVANWAVPGSDVLGIGGAMDLLEGARRLVVTTLHVTSSGDAKLVRDAGYPLTSNRSADVVVTDLAVFRVVDGGLVLVEVMPGSSLDEITAKTDAPFQVRLDDAAEAAG